MQKTIRYYNEKAEEFVKDTRTVKFEDVQNRFLRCLPETGRILDFGCGSGRDTKYFLLQGYEVDAIDGSEEICKLAEEYIGIRVKRMLFRELDEKEKYDGIWACASILHLKKEALPDIFSKMYEALKNGGILYVSFKYGDFEGERNGRYFTDLTERTASDLWKHLPGFMIEKCWITGDVRAEREEEKWLNYILKKQNIH